MTKPVHRIYVGAMVVTVIAVTSYLIYTGYSYYDLPLEERFYDPRHDWFKPSGVFGHGLGIVGTLMILFGVVIYIARKRYNFLGKIVRLKYLLEFHIFLCILGPILILFHTAFKFGGIVSISFWSMVAVVFSGVIGRFVYIQIPRTIEGRELTLNEVKNMKEGLSKSLQSATGMDDEMFRMILAFTSRESLSGSGSFMSTYFENRKAITAIQKKLKQKNVGSKQRRYAIRLVKEEVSLGSKIKRLQTMQKLFKYWHVAHLPFAMIMLIILIIHVAVTLSFGYKWIF